MIDLRKKIKQQMAVRGINVPSMSRRIRCNQQTLYNFLAGGNMTSKYVEAVLDQLGGKIIFKNPKKAVDKKRR